MKITPVFFALLLFSNVVLSQSYTVKLDSTFAPSYLQYNQITTQAYPDEKRDYFGVPLEAVLMKSDCTTWEIQSTDSFITVIDKSQIEHCKDKGVCPVILYDKDGSWPKKSRYGGYVGKFYLAWLGNNNHTISREMWAWNVESVTCYSGKRSCESMPNLSTKLGCKLFETNCHGCHSVERKNKESIGPNLLYPMSPVEYFKSRDILKRYIRNPQQVRIFKNDKMAGFDKLELSDKDIDLIVNYLDYLNDSRNKN